MKKKRLIIAVITIMLAGCSSKQENQLTNTDNNMNRAVITRIDESLLEKKILQPGEHYVSGDQAKYDENGNVIIPKEYRIYYPEACDGEIIFGFINEVDVFVWVFDGITYKFENGDLVPVGIDLSNVNSNTNANNEGIVK